MRLAEYLWIGKGGPPVDYVDMILCRDVYHCPPDALDRQDTARVRRHLTCLEVESKVRGARGR